MILCPLQNTSEKPIVTQKFGDRPEYYKKYGMNGHNGVDLRAREPHRLFAPFTGEVKVSDTGEIGYGLHVVIRSRALGLEITLGHLSSIGQLIGTGSVIKMGDFIGLTGNSGDSSAPHLHVTLRQLENHDNLKTFSLPVKNLGNGFRGAIDPVPVMLCWQGTLLQDSI